MAPFCTRLLCFVRSKSESQTDADDFAFQTCHRKKILREYANGGIILIATQHLELTLTFVKF